MSTNADSARVSSLTHTSERPAATQNGFAMLFVLLLLLVANVADFGWLAATAKSGNAALPALLLVLFAIAFLFVLFGFYLLQPNQAAAILLFGDYKGTDRHSGLRW